VFDCVTYVSILCGGTTSLPVVIPKELTQTTIGSLVVEVADKLQAMKFIDPNAIASSSPTHLQAMVVTKTPTTITNKPYTQTQINKFNSQDLNSPEPGANLNFSNTVESSPYCNTCTKTVTTWWSTLSSRKWYSSVTFKRQLSLCTKCNKITSINDLLQQMSKKLSIEGPSRYKFFIIEKRE